MIQFKELYITDDRKHLVIEASVIDSSYYTNVYIDNMKILTEDNFLPTDEDSSYKNPALGPVGKALFTFNYNSSSVPSTQAGALNYDRDTSDSKDTVSNTGEIILYKKTIREVIDIDTIQDKMFFVYITTLGTPSSDTPCGMKNTQILGVVYDRKLIYNYVIGLLSSITDCDVPRNLLNNILILKALEMCLYTGQYIDALKYWQLIKNNKTEVKSIGCGCHGRS